MNSDITLTFDSNPFINALNNARKVYTNFCSDLKDKFEQTSKKSNNFASSIKTNIVGALKNISSSIFTFSSNIFNKIKKTTGGFFEHMNKESDSSSKKMKKNSESMFASLLKFEILKQVFSGIFNNVKNAVNTYIPEVSKTFSIAGEIISKNLLWPLRKELIPLLQHFLDWVRNHREMFVSWGVVIRNVFIVVKTVILQVMSLASAFGKALFKSLNITDFMQSINILLFKLVALFNYLGEVFKPIAKELGGVFGSLIKDVTSFLSGFANGFSKIFKTLNTMQTLKSVLQEISVIAKMLEPIFKSLGKILGEITAQLLDIGLNFLDDFLKDTISILKFFGLTNPEDSKPQISEKLKKDNTDKYNLVEEPLKKNIVKSKIENSKNNNSKVNVEASNNSTIKPKNIVSASKSDVSVGDININLNVTEGNAKNAGSNFAKGLSSELQQELLHKMTKIGG